MAYKVSGGLKESELSDFLRLAFKKYGAYQGKAVNYTHSDIAPIVMCTVIFMDEILLVKRSYGLADAEGYWSTVNGFIDQDRPVREIAKQELSEELSLNIDSNEIRVARSYTLSNPKEKRKYIVFPCLIILKNRPSIILDREHTEYAWIKREELESYHILDDLPHAVDSALELKSNG